MAREEHQILYAELIEARVVGPDSRLIAITQKIVSANLRLIRSMAIPGAKRYQIDVDDAFGYATIGLIKAIRKFDPSLGFQLSTYAMPWMRAELENGAEHGELIRKPANNNERHIKLLNSRRQLWAALGREPYVEELAQDTGIRLKDVQLDKDTNWMLEGLDDDRDSGRNTAKNNKRTHLGSMHDPDAVPDVVYELAERKSLAESLLATLTEREQFILKMRFADEPVTLQEIGNQIGLTRERVRQIESQALSKLKKRVA